MLQRVCRADNDEKMVLASSNVEVFCEEKGNIHE
jgi:hypothetical protein